jgi:phage-related protein
MSATNWMMSVEQSVEWELAGETEVTGENLPQRQFVHHKSQMT